MSNAVLSAHCPRQVGPDLRVLVACGRGAGEVVLQSLGGHSDSPVWVSHTRATLSQLTATSATEYSHPSSQPHEGAPRLPRVSAPASGPLFAAAGKSPRGGGMASIGLESRMRVGYQLHPTVADSAMHIGALNPAGPTDAFTRVPVALSVYLVDPSLSSDGARQCGGIWAGVDAGFSSKDGSQTNTYRYVFEGQSSELSCKCRATNASPVAWSYRTKCPCSDRSTRSLNVSMCFGAAAPHSTIHVFQRYAASMKLC